MTASVRSSRLERICAQWRKQESARDTEEGRSLDGFPGVAEMQREEEEEKGEK